MWWVGFWFQLNTVIQSITGAGGLVNVPRIGGASNTKLVATDAALARRPAIDPSNASAGLPPETLDSSRRNFVLDAGALVNKHRIGGALWVISQYPPQSPEDEFEDWLILNNFDFLQAELDHEQHSMGGATR